MMPLIDASSQSAVRRQMVVPPKALCRNLRFPHSALRPRRLKLPSAAFTLVEVVLAIGLATGLLLVALTFYNQAADIRNQVLRESERVSAMRLVLDRLAADLRAAQPMARPGNEFTGDSSSISFVKEACSSVSPDAPLGTSGLTDLVRVSLTTSFATNGARLAVGALDRNEVQITQLPASPLLANSDALFLFASSQTNVPPDQTRAVTEVFADFIRFVRFRYWDGTAWQLGWTNAAPPPGVELVLSAVPNAEDAQPDSFPAEAFRRVVFVPGGLQPGASQPGVSTSAATP
jgi:type II secretory pathway component PulJ